MDTPGVQAESSMFLTRGSHALRDRGLGPTLAALPDEAVLATLAHLSGVRGGRGRRAAGAAAQGAGGQQGVWAERPTPRGAPRPRAAPAGAHLAGAHEVEPRVPGRRVWRRARHRGRRTAALPRVPRLCRRETTAFQADVALGSWWKVLPLRGGPMMSQR